MEGNSDNSSQENTPSTPKTIETTFDSLLESCSKQIKEETPPKYENCLRTFKKCKNWNIEQPANMVNKKKSYSRDIPEFELENGKDGRILEHKIKYKFDFYTPEYEEDLQQLKKRDSSYQKMYCNVIHMYPYKKPIVLSKLQIELYIAYIGLKYHQGKIPEFLDNSEIKLSIEVFKKRVMPQISKLSKLLDLVIMWIFKRYEFHGKVFCYSNSKVEKKYIQKIISDLKEKQTKKSSKLVEEDIFINEKDQLVRKTVSGRTTSYLRVAQL